MYRRRRRWWYIAAGHDTQAFFLFLLQTDITNKREEGLEAHVRRADKPHSFREFEGYMSIAMYNDS